MRDLFRQPGRVLALLLLASSAAFSGVVQITVVASVGPTTDTSGLLNTYLSNAEYALQHGLTSYGTPDTPGYYTAATNPIYAGSIITTTFASWLASALPTGAYANENGNELYFGVSIVSSVAFTMAQVLYSGSLFTGGDLSDLCFNSHTVGSLGGVLATHTADPNCGTGVATIDAAKPIDSFWYSGVSLVDPTVITSAADLAAELALVDGTAGDVTYTLTEATGAIAGSATATFDLVAVPEPGTYALIGLGFGLMLSLRKKIFAARTR